MLAVAEVAAIGAVAEATAAAPIAATVSVRPRWAPLRSEPLRPGPTAAAATTPTATTFAPAGTVRTERRPPCASEVAALTRHRAAACARQRGLVIEVGARRDHPTNHPRAPCMSGKAGNRARLHELIAAAVRWDRQCRYRARMTF